MTLPSPPPPPPEPLGGRPDLETKPGEDPWWWTRFVGEEMVLILAALLVTMELVT